MLSIVDSLYRVLPVCMINICNVAHDIYTWLLSYTTWIRQVVVMVSEPVLTVFDGIISHEGTAIVSLQVVRCRIQMTASDSVYGKLKSEQTSLLM